MAASSAAEEEANAFSLVVPSKSRSRAAAEVRAYAAALDRATLLGNARVLPGEIKIRETPARCGHASDVVLNLTRQEVVGPTA
eukprot:1428741-Pyramimonas_sp.AAC.1